MKNCIPRHSEPTLLATNHAIDLIYIPFHISRECYLEMAQWVIPLEVSISHSVERQNGTFQMVNGDKFRSVLVQ